MNKIMLIGNLGKEPDMNYTPAGVPITRFTMAVNRNTRNPNGEMTKETEWFNIVVFRQLAETCNTYLKKGQKVFIEGRLQTRKYTDRNGAERMSVEVVASDMEMLTPRGTQPDGGSDSYNGPEDDGLGDLEDHPF